MPWKECRAGICPHTWGAHRSLRLSVQSLRCLRRVRAARSHQGSWESPSLAPRAGLSPHLWEPRLVITGAEPIVLRGPGPLSSRSRWPGRAAEPPGSEFSHSSPPPQAAARPGHRWKILNLYPETASCTTYRSQLFIIPLVDGDPDRYLIPSLPGSFGQSRQPTDRVWSGSPRAACPAKPRGPVRGRPQHTRRGCGPVWTAWCSWAWTGKFVLLSFSQPVT